MENNKIKLSQLLKVKKLKFINGKSEWVNPSDELNGEIIFKNINVLNSEYKTLSEKVATNEISNIQYFYGLIPIFTDIDMDISEEQFQAGTENPSPLLNTFLSGLNSHIANIIESTQEVIESGKKINNANNKLKEKLPKKSELEIKKEQFLIISKAYNNEKDTKVKHELFIKKAVLRAEIEELEEKNKNNVIEVKSENIIVEK